jgi:hypothetical protein
MFSFCNNLTSTASLDMNVHIKNLRKKKDPDSQQQKLHRWLRHLYFGKRLSIPTPLRKYQ